MAATSHNRYNSVADTDEKDSLSQCHETFDTFFGQEQPSTTVDEKDDPPAQAAQRTDMTQLNDDLELLRAERYISNQEDYEMRRSQSKTRNHNPEPEDAFNPAMENLNYEKKKNEDVALLKIWRFLKKFPRMVRYFAYMIPGAAVLLIPVLLGALRYTEGSKNVGGVYLQWFAIWLEILWCSLWVSRMLSSLFPHLFYGLARAVGSATPRKWKEIGAQLDLHLAMFLWLLANLIAFKATTYGHIVPDPDGKIPDEPYWVSIVQKVIIALFVLATLNFVEKIIIQWIATSFHQRTYATRIENNKGDIGQVTQLFENAKSKLQEHDVFWQGNNDRFSGSQTPLRALHKNARNVLGKVGYVANRVGNDIIGRKVNENHPRKVVTELLRNTASAHTLARLLYRSLKQEDRDTVHLEDMKEVFATEEEADAAFGVFDKDMNGDISIEEFEAVCNEIHLEKKAIAASLRDLNSVIQKLDKVFLFIILVISIIVFISILSGSAAAGLASAGTSVLGLAWMLQATAQEFLQSIIFVFVKHPFDVGDRVTIYGSTGDKMTGDDYYVTEISLLYTEFKKMQGHIVQAPNSVLNNLFILNQRRSNGLADVIPLEMRFGTTAEQIEDLKSRMLNFVLDNKRDYQSSIISEMTGIEGVRSAKMNLIFFHKTNFQNELLRLNRHNRFVTELMQQMLEVGIQAPLRVEPGGSREHPMYWASMPPPPAYGKEAAAPGTPTEADGVTSLSSMRRSSTRRSSRPHISIPESDNVMGGIQDVFENRRDTAQVNRLAAIREKEIAEIKHASEAEPVPRGSTTSARPGPRESMDSFSRSRMFSRARSKSKNQHDADIV